MSAWLSAFAQSSSELSVTLRGLTNAAPYRPAIVVEIQGPGSTNCLVECSTNLVSWVPLASFYARYATLSRFPTNNLVWDPLLEPGLVRFYRANSPGRLQPDPQQIWAAKKPTRYRFHYETCGILLVSSVNSLAGDVHVEGGVIRSIENVTGGAGLTPQMLTNSFRTIDGLFSLLQNTFKFSRSRVVGFDPEWGYPWWILLDNTKEFDTEQSLPTSHLVTQFAVE